MTVKHAFASAKADGGDATLVRPTDWNADHVITAFALPGDLSPAQITADQNDYNPASLADAAILRLTSDAFRVITGLQGGADGRLMMIVNVGDYPITIKRESSSSTAAYRFSLPHDVTLFPGEAQLFEYDSTSSRWRMLGMANPMEEDVIDISDEFLSLSSESGEIGALGWNQTASGTASSAPLAGATDHPGVFQVGSGGSATNNTRIHQGSSQAAQIFRADQLAYFGAIVRIPTITAAKVRVGIGTDISNANFGTDSAYFEFDPALDASWRAYTRVSSVNDGPTDTTLDVVANNWYLLEIFRTSAGNWEFYINGVRRATHSTQKPAIAMQAGFYVETTGSGGKQLDVDWFRLRLVALGQRWT